MRKRFAAIAALTLVIIGLAGGQSASAAGGGSWQPYGSTFTVPSNWTCGATSNQSNFSAQTCIVRSGNYVQLATIVRNRQPYPISVSVDQTMYNEYDVVRAEGDCATSDLSANSYSVCFSPTVTSTVEVSSTSVVSNAAMWVSLVSPWA